jgi:hypothetical protein
MNISSKTLPRLRITSIHDADLAISFNEPKWMGEQWCACILFPDNKLIWGRFASINADNRTAIFTLDNANETALFQIDSEHEYLDGYWGERAELVFDTKRHWLQTEFAPCDAVRHLAHGKTEAVTGGWDHEHCEICWESISQFDEQKCGYKDQNNNWVCEKCFHSFVEPKKIDFINEPQQQNQSGTE